MFELYKCRKAFESNSLVELLELIKVKSRPILSIRDPHIKDLNNK